MKNCFAIRGATTLSIDSPVEMDAAVDELFEQILQRNALEVEDIAYVILSQTPDLRTKNAASSLRRTGKCDDVPLFCVQEADITGMPGHVVRMMVVVGRPPVDKPAMVYLRGAAALRPDLAGR